MSYEVDYESKNETEEAEKRCMYCHATIVKYQHKLNNGLCAGLNALCQYANATHLDALNLTYNQRTNFPKLQYWGLVAKGAISGTWSATDIGREFVSGQIAVPKYAKSYRGKAVEQLGTPVHFNDIYAYNVKDSAAVTYDKREDYAESAEPR